MEVTMRKLVIRLICAALIVNTATSFAKDKEAAKEKKSYSIYGGFLTPPLVVTYDGPVLPRESTSILVVAKDTMINSIDGIRVDDQGQSVNFLKNPTGNSNIVQLKQGKHTIGISFETKIFQGSLYVVYSQTYVEVSFDAKSGRSYLADANGYAKLNSGWHKSNDVEGSYNPTITDITDALDAKDNHNLDSCFKDSKKIYRISDWLAARQKAASEGHLRGRVVSQILQTADGKNNSFTATSGTH
jgi:hypothetical protein